MYTSNIVAKSSFSGNAKKLKVWWLFQVIISDHKKTKTATDFLICLQLTENGRLPDRFPAMLQKIYLPRYFSANTSRSDQIRYRPV